MAIFDAVQSVMTEWDRLDESLRYWWRGMIVYFCSDDDELNDFRSPIGFEDDAEVLNACLILAGRVI